MVACASCDRPGRNLRWPRWHSSCLGPSPIVLAVFMVWALYLTLRTFSLPMSASATVAGLVLIFPGSDTTRLWWSASPANLALAMALLGLVLTVRGLTTSGLLAAASHVV